MKTLLLLLICFLCVHSFGQTNKDVVEKWTPIQISDNGVNWHDVGVMVHRDCSYKRFPDVISNDTLYVYDHLYFVKRELVRQYDSLSQKRDALLYSINKSNYISVLGEMEVDNFENQMRVLSAQINLLTEIQTFLK